MFDQQKEIGNFLKGLKLTPLKHKEKDKFTRENWPLRLKIFVLNYMENNNLTNIGNVAIFFNQFQEKKTLKRQSIYDWIRDKEKLFTLAITTGVDVNMGRYRMSTKPKTEIALLEWFKNARKNNPKLRISHSILVQVSGRFAPKFNEGTEMSKNQVVAFTRRYDIHSYELQGEKLDANVPGAISFLRKDLPEIIR
jgi:hypothetical protein